MDKRFQQETEKEPDPIDGKLNLILSELSKLPHQTDNKKTKYYFYNPQKIKNMLPKFDTFIQKHEYLIQSNRFPFLKPGDKALAEDLTYFTKYIRNNFPLLDNGKESTMYVSQIFSIFLTYYMLREQEIKDLTPDEKDNLI
ncbi:hypothetical protein C7818_1312 [Leuconostoc mesenteroides]|uniref:hypothetical protein n=1 Tax=Leuconostoc mesenteroides TaxID=1245 RepID=UPI0010657018|nr:hypothetical protein [Leuconostoc mesenteroides]TDV87130.1 hypothetical protein C7818_1312 [Leuconostoc mesenteroides]